MVVSATSILLRTFSIDYRMSCPVVGRVRLCWVPGLGTGIGGSVTAILLVHLGLVGVGVLKLRKLFRTRREPCERPTFCLCFRLWMYIVMVVVLL